MAIPKLAAAKSSNVASDLGAALTAIVSGARAEKERKREVGMEEALQRMREEQIGLSRRGVELQEQAGSREAATFAALEQSKPGMIARIKALDAKATDEQLTPLTPDQLGGILARLEDERRAVNVMRLQMLRERNTRIDDLRLEESAAMASRRDLLRSKPYLYSYAINPARFNERIRELMARDPQQAQDQIAAVGEYERLTGAMQRARTLRETLLYGEGAAAGGKSAANQPHRSDEEAFQRFQTAVQNGSPIDVKGLLDAGIPVNDWAKRLNVDYDDVSGRFTPIVAPAAPGAVPGQPTMVTPTPEQVSAGLSPTPYPAPAPISLPAGQEPTSRVAGSFVMGGGFAPIRIQSATPAAAPVSAMPSPGPVPGATPSLQTTTVPSQPLTPQNVPLNPPGSFAGPGGGYMPGVGALPQNLSAMRDSALRRFQSGEPAESILASTPASLRAFIQQVLPTRRP